MALCFPKLTWSTLLKWVKRLPGRDRISNRKSYFHRTATDRQLKCQDGPMYTTRLALPQDYDNVVDFMDEAYFKHEPVLVNIGLGNKEPAAFFSKIMYDQVKEGMTIIAQDRDHCILGAAVNIGSCPWDPDRAMEMARCCARGPVRDVTEFFAYVTRKPNLWERYNVLKIFECSSLAVSGEFQGLGICKRLLQESWFLARDCGYRLFRIDCTNSYTIKIAEAFGWERVCTIPYCRYVRNGKLVFTNIKEPHTEVQVFVDRVDDCNHDCLRHKKCKLTTISEMPVLKDN